MLTDEIKQELHDYIDDEILGYICVQINEKFDKETLDEKDNIRFIRRELQEGFESIKDYYTKMESIERQIGAHSMGVQNVYEEIKELKEFYKLSTKERSLQKTISEIKEMIEEIMALKEKFEWRLNNQKDSFEKLNKVLEALDN